MRIPSDFKIALHKAYQKQSDLNKLFVEQKPFIMRIVRHSMRHHNWRVFSDEDDIYQEACMWLLDSMWDWDESRGTTLESYVTYNVGVRLRNYIQKETALKRNSTHAPKSISFDHIKSKQTERESSIEHECEIDSGAPTPEELLIVRRVCEQVERELPLLARELLDALIIEHGNMSGASRQILNNGRVRISREITEDAFRLIVSRNILPELRSIFLANHIIPTRNQL